MSDEMGGPACGVRRAFVVRRRTNRDYFYGGLPGMMPLGYANHILHREVV
ncbi:MAG: hypothetical protein R3B07_06950 [Polyangiaceae bacterium]